MECAPRCAGSSPWVFHKSQEQKAVPAFCAFPDRAAQAARGLPGELSPGAVHLLPSTSPAPVPTRAGQVHAPCVSLRPCWRMSTIQYLRRSFIRDWRPVCSAVGAVVLGAEPAPFSSPLPPVSSGAGPVHSLRAFLWTCSVPLFCERTAMCSGRLIFSLSFAIPQFKLVTHKSSLRLSSGHSDPVLTLSNATHSSPFRPRRWWQMRVSGVLFCWE